MLTNRGMEVNPLVFFSETVECFIECASLEGLTEAMFPCLLMKWVIEIGASGHRFLETEGSHPVVKNEGVAINVERGAHCGLVIGDFRFKPITVLHRAHGFSICMRMPYVIPWEKSSWNLTLSYP